MYSHLGDENEIVSLSFRHEQRCVLYFMEIANAFFELDVIFDFHDGK